MIPNPEGWAKLVATTVAGCRFPDHAFHVGIENGQVTLRVMFSTYDDESNHVPSVGRPWIVEFGSHPHQILRTAWLALMTSIEARARERFLYNGCAVMAEPVTIGMMMVPANVVEYRNSDAGREKGVPEHRPLKDVAGVVRDTTAGQTAGAASPPSPGWPIVSDGVARRHSDEL